MRTLALFLFLVSAAFAEPGTDASHYFDEATGRHVSITITETPQVQILVRFPGEPGQFYRWFGQGTRKDREIVFSRLAGAEEEHGPEYLAKLSSSRLEIDFKPGQHQPPDEGVRGQFRRLSDDRRRSMARSDFKAAEDTLEKALKQWGSAKDPNVVEWKRRWPDLAARRVEILYPPAAAHTPPGEDRPRLGSRPTPAMDAMEKQSDFWIAQAEAAGQAISFLRTPPSSAPFPPDGSGDYTDGFGGWAGLRSRADGAYSLLLNCQRGPDEDQSCSISLDIPLNGMVKVKPDDWSVIFDYRHPEAPLEEAPAQFSIRKSGRYLWVDAVNAGRYAGKGWFDGMFRWGPVVPTE